MRRQLLSSILGLVILSSTSSNTQHSELVGRDVSLPNKRYLTKEEEFTTYYNNRKDKNPNIGLAQKAADELRLQHGINVAFTRYPNLDIVEESKYTAELVDDLTKGLSLIKEKNPRLLENLTLLRIGNTIIDPETGREKPAVQAQSTYDEKSIEFSYRKGMSNRLLAHECAHLFFKGIPNFQESWDALINSSKDQISAMDKLYAGLSGDNKFPMKGFLTSYACSAYNDNGVWNYYSEDAPEYVATFYDPQGMKVFARADPKDDRYDKKLTVLKDLEAITKEQYDEAKENLGGRTK